MTSAQRVTMKSRIMVRLLTSIPAGIRTGLAPGRKIQGNDRLSETEPLASSAMKMRVARTNEKKIASNDTQSPCRGRRLPQKSWIANAMSGKSTIHRHVNAISVPQ